MNFDYLYVFILNAYETTYVKRLDTEKHPFVNFLLLSFNESVKILWIKANTYAYSYLLTFTVLINCSSDLKSFSQCRLWAEIEAHK